MAKYLSQLNRTLRVGIPSYTDNTTALQVTGNVGVKTDIARSDFHVAGDGLVSGVLSVDTTLKSKDTFATGISSFRGKVAVGNTDSEPTTDFDVNGPSLFRGTVDVSNAVSAGEYNGPLRFGEPTGGFKPGAIEIDETQFTKNSINDINFILGKLVPKPPATILDASFSIVGLSVGRLCSGFSFTNNTVGVFSPVAGTQYPRNTSNSVTSTWLTEYGPGDDGDVSAMINFDPKGTRMMITNDVINLDNSISNDINSDNGVYTSLEIANDKDAFFSSRNPGIASNFYEVYDSRILNASSPDGFNMAYIKHQVETIIYESQKYLYYEDSSVVPAPVLAATTPVAPASPTLNYSSGIPNYTQATNNAFVYEIVCQNATGDMYSTNTFLTSSGQTTGFENGGNKSYPDFTGGVNPPVRNFGVGVGVTCTVSQVPRNSHHTVTANNQKFSTYTATTPYGSNSVRATITENVNIMGTTARTNVIDEDNILVQSLGTGSGNARRVNAGSSGDNPTPVTTSWVASNPIATYEAVVIGGDLKHDQTNYSTGYLPVGPDYSSGRTGAQYIQLEMFRSNVSEFLISIDGSYGGFWVCMPNNTQWNTSLSGTNGWADMFQAYRGSGIPNSALPGCAFAGNMTGGTGTFTCVFGTESSSNDVFNRILIRIRLDSGDQINTLSFRNT